MKTFMDHTEALELHATERYVLGELSTTEAAAFEEHYFVCADCTADLECATLLVANARAVLPETVPARTPAAARPRTWWSGWKGLLEAFRPRLAMAATSFASLALGGVWIYQTLVTIPRLKQAAVAADTAFVLPAFALAGTSRGDGATVSITPDTRSFAVSFDMDPQTAYPEYRGILKDATGAVRFTFQFSPPPTGQPVTVSLPAHKLQPGKYDLVVDGLRGAQAATSISTFPFTLQVK